MRRYFEHVLQAEEGCDFDFMLPATMQDAAAAKSFLPGALARDPSAALSAPSVVPTRPPIDRRVARYTRGGTHTRARC